MHFPLDKQEILDKHRTTNHRMTGLIPGACCLFPLSFSNDSSMSPLNKKHPEPAEYPSRRLSASDEVFSLLHQWIVSKKIKPGEKLPSQDDLARQFRISRNTLREAIYKLSTMGLVTSKQGIGTVVNITTASNYLASLGDHLLLEGATVREFFETRIFIEKGTARLAARRARPADLNEMQELLTSQETAFQAGDLKEFSRYDAEFHFRLARTARNSVLLKVLETLRDLLNHFIVEVALLPDGMETAIRFHRKILEAVAGQDMDLAEKNMLQHLQNVAERIEENVDMDFGFEEMFRNAAP